MVGYFSKFKIQFPRENATCVLFDGEKVLLVTKPRLGSWQFIHKEICRNEKAESALKKEVSEKTGIKDFEFTRQLKSYHNWKLNSGFKKLKRFEDQHKTLFIMKVNPRVEVNLKEDLDNFKWIHPREIRNYTHYYPQFLDEIFREVERIKNFPESLNPGELFI